MHLDPSHLKIGRTYVQITFFNVLDVYYLPLVAERRLPEHLVYSIQQSSVGTYMYTNGVYNARATATRLFTYTQRQH